MSTLDNLFTKFLILYAKFVRLFVKKPQLGSVDMKKSDILKEDLKNKQ